MANLPKEGPMLLAEKVKSKFMAQIMLILRSNKQARRGRPQQGNIPNDTLAEHVQIGNPKGAEITYQSYNLLRQRTRDICALFCYDTL
jgi:hypothetical protein